MLDVIPKLQNITVEHPVFLNHTDVLINSTANVLLNSTNNVLNNGTNFDLDHEESAFEPEYHENYLTNLIGNGLGLPSFLQNVLYGDLDEQGQNHGTARSGCNDAFSVFGFLAFLLALLDLLMDAGGARKRRDTDSCENFSVSSKDNPLLREGTLAAYSMFRGFLNALENEDKTGGCAKLAICEAAGEAANLGEIGEIVSRVASLNAVQWLKNIDPSLGRGIKQAGHFGAKYGAAECTQRYKCKKRANHYRFPGHAFSNATVANSVFDINDDLAFANEKFLSMMSGFKDFM